MDSFDMLSESMKKKIWEQKWEYFTDIQNETIPIILGTSNDVVLSSATASGKTEAAFLPILSAIEKSAQDKLKVLYVSPLKALINNQFERIGTLTESLNIKITKWHGDASYSNKKKFVKNPTGILQITPESIESLFVNKSNYLPIIFDEVEYIIIDELHVFIDSERGVQLRSLLHRLDGYCKYPPRLIGLSATISNFDLIKSWVRPSNENAVKIIEAINDDKELMYSLYHFTQETVDKKPLELIEDIRELTRDKKAIIFCNARADVEETTVLLNRIAEREKCGVSYYAHHSSINKDEREHVEKIMSSTAQNKSIIATSSLELGIDIGDIDLVIQVDSTHSVTSLKQRLGRSGRRQDTARYIQLYSTYKYSLLQALAIMELLLEGWIEPAQGYRLPYDILFHQVISLCNEYNGLQYNILYKKIREIGVFDNLSESNIKMLLEEMVDKDYLEQINGSNELIVGLEGERLLRHWGFYSVFFTSPVFEVIHNNKVIGTFDKTGRYRENENVILAGKLWTIINIDINKEKIYVVKAVNADRPRFSGGGSKLNKKISVKMHSLICSNDEFKYISEDANDTLGELRMKYHINNIKEDQRVIWNEENKIVFEAFTGTRIANTLYWMFKALGIKDIKLIDNFGTFHIYEKVDLKHVFNEIVNRIWKTEDLINVTRSNEFYKSKYIEYLPEKLQIEMHITNEIDIDGVLDFINEYELIYVNM